MSPDRPPRHSHRKADTGERMVANGESSDERRSGRPPIAQAVSPNAMAGSNARVQGRVTNWPRKARALGVSSR